MHPSPTLQPSLRSTGAPARAAAFGRAWLALPFDALRQQYAGVVEAGLLPRSKLASARVERTVDALERFVLGPLARRR